MKLTLRPMTRRDLGLIADWLGRPHVARWWHGPENLAAFEAKFAPRLTGEDPTALFVAEVDGTAIGMLQSYWVSDYPDYAAAVGVAPSVGVDLFIGEENYLARGHGPEMLRDFVRHVVPDKYPGAEYVVSSPSVDNTVSIRAFEKAGFIRGITFAGDDGREQLLIIAL